MKKRYLIKTVTKDNTIVERIIEVKNLISTIRYIQEIQGIKTVGYKLI